MTSRPQNRKKAILCIISAAFFFALMNCFVRLSGDLPTPQKSFFRNFIAFIIAAFVLIKSGEKTHPHKSDIPYLFVRSAAGTIGILGNFYAVDHMASISDASMLNKMAPFFTIIFSYLILKEKPRLFQTVCVILAFVGSLFIIKPSMDFSRSMPALIGLCGGLGAGLAYTFVRILSGRGVAGSWIVLIFSGFSCAVTLPVLIFDYAPMTGTQVLTLLGAGIAAAGGQFSVTAAYSNAPAKEISIFDYSQIIFAALFGYFLFDQIPDIYSFIGYIIVIGASAFMFFYNKANQ